MGRRLLLLSLVAVAVSACGRRGAPRLPEGDATYPLFGPYPKPAEREETSEDPSDGPQA